MNQPGQGQPESQPSPEPPSSPPDSGGLSADQQKVRAAVDKIAAAQPPSDAAKQPPKIHKSIFKAPPDAVLEKDFDVEPAVVGDTTPTVKIEDTNKSNIHKDDPAPKKVDAVKPVTPPPPKTTDVKVKPSDAKPFDYSGFAPEEQVVLKQMSNQARDFVAKNLRELNELKNRKPELYYQHENAYVLDPQYKELETTLGYVAKESQHWKEQLLKIRKGQDWMMLEGYNEKGEPILKGPFKASDEADINVSNALQVLTGEHNKMLQQRAGFGQQYQQRVKQDNAVLDAERAARFEWVKDPAKLEEKVDIGGKVGEVTIKQIKQDFKGLFASYHQGNPVLELASDMFAALQIYGARIRELEGTGQHKDRIKEDILNSEPNMETNKGEGKAEVEFNTEGLPS